MRNFSNILQLDCSVGHQSASYSSHKHTHCSLISIEDSPSWTLLSSRYFVLNVRRLKALHLATSFSASLTQNLLRGGVAKCFDCCSNTLCWVQILKHPLPLPDLSVLEVEFFRLRILNYFCRLQNIKKTVDLKEIR